MLKFDHRGHLVPYGAIDSTLEEVEEVFVTAFNEPKRDFLWQQFSQYLADLKTICGDVQLTIWINGSFVTRKKAPGDIDLTIHIPQSVRHKSARSLQALETPESIKNYYADCYFLEVVPAQHPQISHYQGLYAYWLNHYTKTRPGRNGTRHDKGFIQISL